MIAGDMAFKYWDNDDPRSEERWRLGVAAALGHGHLGKVAMAEGLGSAAGSVAPAVFLDMLC